MVKAWVKRMIWFFGMEILWTIHSVINLIFKVPTQDLDFISAIGVFGILFIPMMFMGDD